MSDVYYVAEAVSAALVACVGAIGYAFKRIIGRVDQSEMDIIKNKIQIEKKTSPEQVKEIINDKVAAIKVIVENIQEDVKEIKSELKAKHD